MWPSPGSQSLALSKQVLPASHGTIGWDSNVACKYRLRSQPGANNMLLPSCHAPSAHPWPSANVVMAAIKTPLRLAAVSPLPPCWPAPEAFACLGPHLDCMPKYAAAQPGFPSLPRTLLDTLLECIALESFSSLLSLGSECGTARQGAASL